MNKAFFTKNNEKFFCIGTVIVFAVFYFWMAAQIPYTHDDWDWGIDNGIYQLFYGNINGRYTGNFFEVIMTRSPVLKCIIMGLCYLLIPLELSYFSSRDDGDFKVRKFTVAFLLANCLIFTMDRVILQQTYGWCAGFANFVISMVFFAVWLRELTGAFEKELSVSRDTPAKLFVLFVLSTAGQLFLENLALYNLLLSLFMVTVYSLRRKKPSVRHIVLLSGALVGTVITFSSSIYSSLISTGEAVDGCRELTVGSGKTLSESIEGIFNQTVKLLPRVFENNSYICYALLLLLTAVAVINLRKNKKLQAVLFSVINISFLIYFITENYVVAERTQEDYLPDFFVSLGFFIAVSVQIIFIFRNDRLKQLRMMSIFCSAPTVIAPVALTTEVGSRLFFTSNFFLMLFVLLLLNEIISSVPSFINYAGIGFLLVCSAVLLLLHGETYGEIGQCKRDREKIISQTIETGEKTMVLPPFPNRGYIWLPDPTNEDRVGYFKEFYGIDEDVEIEFLR